MANLQAQMRSLGYLMPGDPTALLRQVNRVLFESTAPQHYATLFFGIYDDATRRLEYANCGHNPPLWIGPGGEVRRLPATGTVIGAFESWHGEVAEAQLAPGDLLAIYSDGVTEASRGEEEFGEERLTGELLAVRDRPAEDVVDRVLHAVQEFGAGTQSDDLTLLVAKAR
jgi:serine phosphatase RsbU (regulator of sigma subunit)